MRKRSAPTGGAVHKTWSASNNTAAGGSNSTAPRDTESAGDLTQGYFSFMLYSLVK